MRTDATEWRRSKVKGQSDLIATGVWQSCFVPIRRFGIRCTAALILGIHIGLVAWLGFRQSPNIDETAHIAAGMAMWQYGSFDYYRVNPPLMRAIATIPVVLLPHEPVWADFDEASRLRRPEFSLGAQFIESHPDRWRVFLTAARWAIIPVSVLGGIFCFFWAKELFSPRAGIMALCLWCFCPNVITWSAVLSTDGTAATFGVGAAYFFWRWLRAPTHQSTILAGVFLGVALLSKMTWLVLLVAWPSHWLLNAFLWRRCLAAQPSLWRLICVMLIGIYTLNLGYGFRGSFTRLGDFSFHSTLLTADMPNAEGAPSNRFSDSLLGKLPVPFPAPMVIGIDEQRTDFETGMPSYLFGKWQNHGWWYYYLVGFVLKVPLGTLALTGLTLTTVFVCRKSGDDLSEGLRSKDTFSHWYGNQLSVVLPGVVVLALVSSQDGFSRHFRYALPVFPFLFIWISQTVDSFVSQRNRLLRIAPWILLSQSVASCLAVFPHTMAFFNELAGGSSNGHWHMLGSSLSWSEDQSYLSEWLARNPQVNSPYVLLDRPVSVKRLGIQSRGVPPGWTEESGKVGSNSAAVGPVPGWHVISIQKIHEPDGSYLYFLDLEPETVIGHSIYIYHLDIEVTNVLRQSLGLPPLPAERELPDSFLQTMMTSRDSREIVRIAVFTQMVSDVTVCQSVMSSLSGDECLKISLVTEEQIRSGCLKAFDVLIVPGGQSSIYGTSLGLDGRDAVRRFVAAGGGYVGICAGARLATVSPEWALGLVNARTESGQRFLPGHGTVSVGFRGWGQVHLAPTEEGTQVFENFNAEISLEHTGGPIFIRANRGDLADYVSLATFTSELQLFAFQQGGMVNTPAVIASQYGQGRVILFSVHPESTTYGAQLLTVAIKGVSRE